MLATLTKPTDPPPGPEGWSFERKYDGVRVIATREAGERPRLWSRNQKPADASYPEVVEALEAAAPDRFVLDGEIVAADGRFGSLQARMHLSDPTRARATGVEIECHLFDLLVLDGLDVTGLPLGRVGRCWSRWSATTVRCCTRRRSTATRWRCATRRAPRAGRG